MSVEESYRTGEAVFAGLALHVARGALVPRAETELLAETAIALLRSSGNPSPRVVDMCCGSGNLACAIAHHLPGARVWASDLTDGCIEVARTNVSKLALGDRVNVSQGDLFAGLAGLRLEGSIDMVVCNPPYISAAKLTGEAAHLLEHEPREAFDGGPYGLSIHQRVVRDALLFLRPAGHLLFEIGFGQDRQVKILFDRARGYEEVRMVANAASELRVALGRRCS